MSEFDPKRPAVLHDRLNDKTITWTGDDAEHFRTYAVYEEDGTVGWDGLILDGWNTVLVS
jgi:hypothetical protein